jgi:glycosyltransferase involved in cell wall biosynthesis
MMRGEDPDVETATRGRLSVFLATSGHSGVDRVMGNLLPAIAERGIRVDLLQVRNHGPYLESGGNLKVVELGSAHSYSSLLPLARYLRTVRPDALLSDKDRVNRVALAASALSGASTRIVVRTGITVSEDLKLRKPLDRLVNRLSMTHFYKRAHRVILPSSAAVRDFLEVTDLPEEKVLALPSPVLTPSLLEKASGPCDHPWFSDGEAPVIVGIGELSGRKDFETLVRAFALVRSKRPARLLIYGEGKRRSSLEALAGQLGISGDVDLPGFTDNPYAALARADLYVHSSTLEGSPVALMEAVSLGVPSVSTDCPSGPAEILRDGRYGPLVGIGDDEAMAAAMIQILDDPPHRDHVREAGRAFTLEESAKAYMKALGFEEQGISVNRDTSEGTA